VAVVDAYKGRVERTLERFSRARPFKHYTDLLADKSIDAVVVATPDHWHRKIILDSLAAGKDVYSEKPLTYKASEGVEIIEAARKHGRIVQVGSQGMSSDHQQKARDFVQSGKLGKVTLIK